MTPLVTVRYWAGARRAAGRAQEELSADTVAELIDQLSSRPELAQIVKASSILVDGVAARPEAGLHVGDTVDVLPPFAGG